MTSARKDGRTPGEELPEPVDPDEWVKPVELIELLARRTQKRKKREAPTSSPFYDAEFVDSHRTRRKRRSN